MNNFLPFPRVVTLAGVAALALLLAGPNWVGSPAPTNPPRARPAPPRRRPPASLGLADLTCVATRQGWAYLAGVMDACSRRIVGWALAESMPASLVAHAFQRAVTQRRPAPGLLHHSDRGSQYASDAYRHLIHLHGVIPGMSRAANCN